LFSKVAQLSVHGESVEADWDQTWVEKEALRIVDPVAILWPCGEGNHGYDFGYDLALGG